MTTPDDELEANEIPVETYPFGDYTVRLLMEFNDCTDPGDAVEQFIENIVSYGLRGFTYRVSHGNNEVWLVQDGGIESEADRLAGQVPDGTS